MRLPIYQVDAFTDTVFRGNPAAVCPLETWLPDDLLQSIAAENNLSETAFFTANGSGDDSYHLRWFTPTTEVPLCGHATLATGFVIATQLDPGREVVCFTTNVSGPLTVARAGDRWTMDLPAWSCDPVPLSDALTAALGARPDSVMARPGWWMAVFAEEATIRAIAPDMAAIAALPMNAILVTAPGAAADIDFVSRMFAPADGIPEDPVTGSAHCITAPYWAGRLGKTTLAAWQLSQRGGEIGCRIDGDRVILSGAAALYLTGTITV